MAEQSTPKRSSLSPGWLLFAALALAIPTGALLLSRAGAPAAPLPVIAELPEFKLFDEQGRPFGRGELRGRVWVADFVFTSCSDACPRLTQKMKALQDRLLSPEQGGQISLLSISVDPDRDTPEKLRDYGQAFGARPGLWKWATGSQGEIERTVVQGFKMAVVRQPRVKVAGMSADQVRAEAFDIFHGEKLVLVDAQGRIRGYFDADEQDALLRAARSLTTGGRG